jgi:hypothetical protein
MGMTAMIAVDAIAAMGATGAATAAAAGAAAYGMNEAKQDARDAAGNVMNAQQNLRSLMDTEAPVMPTAGLPSPDENAKRRRSISEQLRRRGRASTILTSQAIQNEPLGGA